jgi:hypothetical protein
MTLIVELNLGKGANATRLKHSALRPPTALPTLTSSQPTVPALAIANLRQTSHGRIRVNSPATATHRPTHLD